MSPKGDSPGPTAKSPPHSLEAEQCLLGDVMRRPQAYHIAAAVVSEEDFYTHDHRTIWRAIELLAKAGKDTDFVSLTEKLRDIGELNNAGGQTYLGTLQTDATGRAENHAARVHELAQRRRLIAFAMDVSNDAYSGSSAEELLGSVTTNVEALLRTGSTRSVKFGEMAERALDQFCEQRAQRDRGEVIGFKFGLQAFDTMTGGLHGPRLIVLAARPKCGKTALLNQGAIETARAGLPGYIASIEMGDGETSARMLALHSGANVTRLQRGQDHDVSLAMKSLHQLRDLPLWCDYDQVYLESIVAQIALHKMRYGIRWAAVDHIGLIRTRESFRSRNDQLGHVSWTLKQATKRLGIPIIALSQLGRECDKDGRRPRADDLRDSGNIEQDADMVIMIHMPILERLKFIRVGEIGITANRAGPSLWMANKYQFSGAVQRFTELASDKGVDHAAPTGPDEVQVPQQQPIRSFAEPEDFIDP